MSREAFTAEHMHYVLYVGFVFLFTTDALAFWVCSGLLLEMKFGYFVFELVVGFFVVVKEPLGVAVCKRVSWCFCCVG